jgi:mannose-6-phosphate isomerase-like protein (cupin superfamily)
MKNEIICLGHKIKVHTPSGNYDMIEGTTLPNVPGPPPHLHTGFSETFYVLEGQMEFEVNGKPVVVDTGNSIDLPPDTLHTFRNTGEVPCRYLNIHSPKGFLSFFEEFGIDANVENAFEKSVDGHLINNVLQRATDFDMHIAQP